MHPFANYVLSAYYKATGWNEDGSYSTFDKSSKAVLDFIPPEGLNFSISSAPNSMFKTSYSMAALPRLNGSIGYLFTSCGLKLPPSARVPLGEVINRFRVYDIPLPPTSREEIWHAGQLIHNKDYLLYGRFYIPSGRMEAFYANRLSRNFQLLVASMSHARSRQSQYLQSLQGHQSKQDPSTLMLSLQHDTGKWYTEYTWSVEDGMLGFRTVHNFGQYDQATPVVAEGGSSGVESTKRVDEEEAMEGGLKGRISAGFEAYFSPNEKSAGVSTGIRFSTIPDATPPSGQLLQSGSSFNDRSSLSGPPTTLTAVFNPVVGRVETAYATRVSRDVTMATRYMFNIYSYDSEWDMGVEWWLRRKRQGADLSLPLSDKLALPHNYEPDAVVNSKVVTEDAEHPKMTPEPEVSPKLESDKTGVVKASMSTSMKLSLMWEGRLKNVLVSLGMVSHLGDRSKPIQQVGLELSYFSSE